MSAELPEGVTVEDLEEIVDESETVLDVQQELRIGRIETRTLLNRHGLGEEVWAANCDELLSS